MENATERAILKSNTWYNIGASIKNHCYVVWYVSGILANHVMWVCWKWWVQYVLRKYCNLMGKMTMTNWILEYPIFRQSYM